MADLPWGDERTKQFVTNVGLITSTGPNGENIMACEWAHHVSYQPGLIAVCIKPEDATAENISKTKEFGVNICSSNMNVASSVSGGSSGRSSNKIAVLTELGFKFYNGKKIKALMVEGATLNIECKLIKEITLGDHIMFVGEVLETKHDINKEPLVYHNLKYYKLGEIIQKPDDKELEKVKELVLKHTKK